jgi:uncharacterized protein YlzI (FlbEa/FlbD family)
LEVANSNALIALRRKKKLRPNIVSYASNLLAELRDSSQRRIKYYWNYWRQLMIELTQKANSSRIMLVTVKHIVTIEKVDDSYTRLTMANGKVYDVTQSYVTVKDKIARSKK